MKEQRLGDFVEFAYGKSLPLRSRRAGSVPVYGSNGIVGWHDEALVAENTVVVGRKGSAGSVHLTSSPSFPIDTTYFVRPRPGVELDAGYAFYALKHLNLGRMRTETGVPGLNRADAYRQSFALPRLDEQRRIAAILNRTAKIERLRDQATERLREFLSALFVGIFGDPVDNPMGWRKETLGALTQDFRYGTSRKCSTDQLPGDMPVLRIPNVVGGALDWGDLKFCGFEDHEASTLRLRPGDILFVRTNGNPNYIGRCAVYEDARPAAFASYLIRARLASSAVAPRFLTDALALPSMRRMLLSLARTTAGNYNISVRSLASMPVPVPTDELQAQYVRLAHTADALLHRSDASAAASAKLSSSMMTDILSPPELPRNE